jgi:hypothetical protein
MAAERLQRRMALGNHAALLGDLTLEQSRLGAIGRERGIAFLDDRGNSPQLALLVVRQNCDQAERRSTFGSPEKRRDPPPIADRTDDRASKRFGGKIGQLAK